MNRMIRTSIAAATAIAATSALAQNRVFNGSFESPPSSPLQCFTGTLGGWTNSGPAESCYLNNSLGSPYPIAADGSQYMYINRNSTAGVKVQQTVVLVQGHTYQLSFSLAGLDQHFGGTLVVSIENTPILTASTPDSSSAWVPQTASFTSSINGVASLSFASVTINAPLNIDQVSLIQTAVPEPSSLALFTAGTLLIGCAVSRSRQART